MRQWLQQGGLGRTAKTVSAGAKSTSGGATLVQENFAPGCGTTLEVGTIFQQAFCRRPKINATIVANDGIANAMVTGMIADGVKPGKIPVTGRDATAQGIAYILQGYQCGSVYKPVYKEAEDAVSVATILLVGDKVPPALLNRTTTDPADASVTEPGVAAERHVGDQVQHGVDGGAGRLRHRHGDLRDRRGDPVRDGRDQVII